MGVRRQIKVDRDSISLAGLLRDIQATPECLSRDWYRAQYDDRLEYYRLLKVISIESLVPTFQYDWQEVFHVPWLPIQPT